MPATRTAVELADIGAKLHTVETARETVSATQRALDVAQESLAAAVRAARNAGASWSEISLAAGLSRQAAFKRWRETEESDQ